MAGKPREYYGQILRPRTFRSWRSTAMFQPSEIETYIDAGCSDYIVKPFTFVELQRKITALIR